MLQKVKNINNNKKNQVMTCRVQVCKIIEYGRKAGYLEVYSGR